METAVADKKITPATRQSLRKNTANGPRFRQAGNRENAKIQKEIEARRGK
jgi:hypothetical protein